MFHKRKSKENRGRKKLCNKIISRKLTLRKLDLKIFLYYKHWNKNNTINKQIFLKISFLYFTELRTNKYAYIIFKNICCCKLMRN